MRRDARFASLALLTALVASPVAAAAQFVYPYPYSPFWYAPESNLRIDVTPKNAAVYVDGYFAGFVDQFDGAFQRLHVAPGQHEIVIYLAGYRSIHEQLYLSPNTTRKIVRTMDALAQGEPSEPVPQPSVPPGAAGAPPAGRPVPRRGTAPPPPATAGPRDAQGATLVIRVEPSDAELLIDGERWQGPTGDDRLLVQVAAGRHRIEVRKEGYEPFTTDVDAGNGESVPINASLGRAR